MQRLRIQGGVPLEGTITLHGAKNSALPILAAALLCQDTVTLQNCPQLTDVFTACRILTRRLPLFFRGSYNCIAA